MGPEQGEGASEKPLARKVTTRVPEPLVLGPCSPPHLHEARPQRENMPVWPTDFAFVISKRASGCSARPGWSLGSCAPTTERWDASRFVPSSSF